LNDPAILTCLANDYGYEFVFAKQLDWHAKDGDILVAISSSGRSKSILNGVTAARRKGCRILTFSGFGADNPLRQMGDINIYVESSVYGFVELGHLAILHGVLDIETGWKPVAAAVA
jgi:D-sedoheptulose 7-phosphate isomerase